MGHFHTIWIGISILKELEAVFLGMDLIDALGKPWIFFSALVSYIGRHVMMSVNRP